MSKRFTETDKWKDVWFRKLQPIEKLVFVYLTDNCNNAGFIEIDSEFAAYQIGITEDEFLGAIKGLDRGCLGADNWLWIKNFLRHQKNDILNPENNAHKQIISLFNEQSKRFSGCSEFIEFLGANKGLFSPIGKGKGKGKGKEDEFEEKQKHGDFVKLTVSEYEKLTADFGQEKTDDFIKQVNDVFHMKPKVKNEYIKGDHNRLIRNWKNKGYFDTGAVKKSEGKVADGYQRL